MTAGVTVVKLGGSHAGSPLLNAWIGALRPGVVVVPGGGPFADAVRIAQPDLGFDDAAAHDMALMAMAQYGRALAGLAGWIYAEDLATIKGAVRAGKIPVWSPWPMLRGHPDIAPSWAVTSDSLAVWLATQLGAAAVRLIKHCAAPIANAPAAWAQDGIVDAAFPEFAARFGGVIKIWGPADLAVQAA